MLRPTLIAFCLVAAVAGCSHQFTPTPRSQDVADRDPDAARPDRRPGDRQAISDPGPRERQPDVCEPLGPAQPPYSDCAQAAAWTCVGQCKGAGRLACLKGSPVRELRCALDGSCECRVGENAPVTCPTGLDNGRTGCDRARELLAQGCCKP